MDYTAFPLQDLEHDPKCPVEFGAQEAAAGDAVAEIESRIPRINGQCLECQELCSTPNARNLLPS